jgi:hypothetical protein
VIDGVAKDGGYIMDASAIMQNDSRVDNVRAMTEFTREYGVYSDGHSTPAPPCSKSDYAGRHVSALPAIQPGSRPPGSVVPWDTKRAELGELSGNVQLLKDIWTNVDSLANTYIWQLLLSF